MRKELQLNMRMDSLNAKKLANFFDKYELISALGDMPEEYYIGNSSPKICRFCKKKEPEVNFNNRPHVIPEFMGSHNLLSHFECDECNAKFSKYEASFANYLGINRTTARISGKNGKLPKFTDNKNKMKLEMVDSKFHCSLMEGYDVFSIDEENKTASLKYHQPSYIPIHIPKLLWKIGFSALSEEDLSHCELVRRLIICSDEESGKFNNSDMLKILAYVIPGPTFYNTPFLHVFRKKESFDDTPIPTYQMIFYYAYYQFQMIIPSDLDKKNEHGKIDIPVAPLFLDYSDIEKFGHEKFHILNLSSNKKKIGTEQELKFSFESFSDDILT